MSDTRLSRDCLDFAQKVTEICFADDNKRLIKDQLVRVCHGMAYHAKEAAYNRHGRAAEELELACRALTEAELWIELFRSSRVFSEADFNRLERKLASLRYRLSKKLKEVEEKGEKIRRFHTPKVVFSSPRLRIRSWLMRDIESFMSLCLDDAGSLTFSCGNDRDEAVKLVKELVLKKEFYVVTRRSDDEFIGCIRIFSDGMSKRRYRIEYALTPRYRGRGYSFDLITSASDFAFERLGAKVVSAYLDSDTSFLINTFIRCGFAKEGVLLSYGEGGKDVTVLSKRM